MSRTFSLSFLLGVLLFQVLSLGLVYFKFIFVFQVLFCIYLCKIKVQCHSFACGYPIFPAPFVQRLSFLHCIFMRLSDINWLYMHGFISRLSILPGFVFSGSKIWPICLFLCQWCISLMPVTLQFILKPGNVLLPGFVSLSQDGFSCPESCVVM